MSLPSTIAELTKGFDTFVLECLPEIAASEAHLLDNVFGDDRPPVVLYGFGDVGRRLLSGLRRAGINPVCIIDNRLSADNTTLDGIPCLGTEEGCRRFGDQAVFVVSLFNQSGSNAYASIRATLAGLGAKQIRYFMPVMWRYASELLPYYCFDLPSKIINHQTELIRVYHALADDESRACFAFHLYQLVCPDPVFTVEATLQTETYFPPAIVSLSRQEVFVDGGAYDGVTLSRFIERCEGECSAYIGVEPDPESFAKLKDCVETFRSRLANDFSIRSCALGGGRGSVTFGAVGTISSAADAAIVGGLKVEVLSLPDVVGGYKPSLIKLDIEGAELETLQGGVELLQRSRSTLAVCVYHRQDHFWSIPLFVLTHLPDFTISLRRHREYLDDFVMYAVPPERLKSL
jgi:FkbM family methyltransferase